MAADTKASDACAGLADGTIPQCAFAIPANPPPNLDALSASLAAQANAISAQANYLTLGTIFLGVVALAATIGWGFLVKIWAEKAAKDAVKEWLNQNATNEISKIVRELIPERFDGGGAPERPPMSQSDQEAGLGGDPTQEPG